MGKGKGSVEFWAAKVKPGRIMFEIDGVSESVAREALRLAAMKLPCEDEGCATGGLVVKPPAGAVSLPGTACRGELG